jgi:hypothetical protein
MFVNIHIWRSGIILILINKLQITFCYQKYLPFLTLQNPLFINYYFIISTIKANMAT